MTATAELEVMCGLVRAALGTDSPARGGWRADAARLERGRFEELVRRHRLGAFLARRLPEEAKALLPEGGVAVLTAIAAEGARAALARAAELVRLTRACADAGLPVLAVKGLVLAQGLYGNVAHRHSGDIDLVFRPGQVGAADAVLRACGYRRTRPDFELTPRQHREYLGLKPEFEYGSAKTRIRVELHWRLEGIDESEAWRVPARCRLGGCDIQTLRGDLNLRYLCEHGARHGWFRLFWLVDVALLLNGGSVNGPQVREAARRCGDQRALAQTARLVEELLGVRMQPEGRAEAGAEGRTVVWLAGEARRLLAAPENHAGGVVEWARQLRYRAALASTAEGKWRTLKPHLYSPLGWSMLRLPDHWFWLYLPLTPFLWLWRRLAPNRKGRDAAG